MKTATLISALIVMAFSGMAQEAQGNDISVSITNVLSDKGKVMVSLHTIDTFMKEPGIQNLESAIDNGTVSVTFTDVPAGTYAIMALHDANENNRMDFDENGRPKESYGMSGNEMTMGPPTFETAKFEVTDTALTFEIRF
ncbi:MAG: DUF2141 domain-containing protein [Bacteroidota bacterium]